MQKKAIVPDEGREVLILSSIFSRKVYFEIRTLETNSRQGIVIPPPIL